MRGTLEPPTDTPRPAAALTLAIPEIHSFTWTARAAWDCELADLRQSENIGRCFAVGALAIRDPAYFAVKRFRIPRPRLYRTGQPAVQADCAVWPVNGHSPTTAHELRIAAPSS
jgi:hypothetical protein